MVDQVHKRILGLTVIQPWASLIVLGHKLVENRQWAPRPDILMPGDFIAIHAGAKPNGQEWIAAADTAAAGGLSGSIPILDGLTALEPGGRFGVARHRAYVADAVPYGAIVGVVRFTGTTREKPEGDSPWWFGPVGWMLEDPVAFARPIPCHGQPLLWGLPAQVYGGVRTAYQAARKDVK